MENLGTDGTPGTLGGGATYADGPEPGYGTAFVGNRSGTNDAVINTGRTAAELGLDFIFEVNQEFGRMQQRFPHLPGDLQGFHVKEGIGGLRSFQMTMWLYAFERWLPSRQVYQQSRNSGRFEKEGAPTPALLSAVGTLFTTRCWLEQRRQQQQSHDVPVSRQGLLLDREDMEAFRGRFGAEGLTELNAAREAINSYRHETMDRLLDRGVSVPGTKGQVIWGTNGLRVDDDAIFQDATELFFAVYGAQQKLRLPIDPAVKRAARKNIANSIIPSPAFIGQLVAEGAASVALRDWYEFGALDCLIPGFAKLSNHLYQPGHRTAALTRARTSG